MNKNKKAINVTIWNELLISILSILYDHILLKEKQKTAF